MKESYLDFSSFFEEVSFGNYFDLTFTSRGIRKIFDYTASKTWILIQIFRDVGPKVFLNTFSCKCSVNVFIKVDHHIEWKFQNNFHLKWLFYRFGLHWPHQEDNLNPRRFQVAPLSKGPMYKSNFYETHILGI